MVGLNFKPRVLHALSNLPFDFLTLGTGNPIGGLVFSSAFGSLEQIHEWTVSTIATAQELLIACIL